jgi:hypothetical protein
MARLETEMDERTRSELGELVHRREVLEADIDALGAFVEEQRTHLRASLAQQLEMVEATLSIATPPPVSPVALPPAPPAAPHGSVLAGVRSELADALRRAEADDDGDGEEEEEVRPIVDLLRPVEATTADDDFLDELRRAMDDTSPLGPPEAGSEAATDLDHSSDDSSDDSSASRRFRGRRGRR